MAFFDSCWYCNAGDQSTTGYYAVTKWATGATIAAGALRRQNTAPAVGSERVFICIVAGTTHATTEPTWVLTRGAKTIDNTVTWQECTGASAINGDLTDTANWTQAKAIGTPTLGAIIQRNSGASYQICTTAGTLGVSEPAFSNTAGVTTTETSATTVWTSLGPVGNFTGGQAPHARLANACATNWFAAGNTVYVGDNHAESQATIITIAPTGSGPLVGRILCHNHSGSYPPASTDLTTGATITTTGAVNLLFSPSAAGGFYLYGLTFRDAVGQSSNQNLTLSSGNSWIYCDRCLFDQSSTGNAPIVVGSGSGGLVTFNNTTVKFANVLSGINLTSGGPFIWQNTGPILASGSSVPNNLISSLTGGTINVTFEALDLSQLTGNIFNSSVSVPANLIVKDCKLNAATVVPTPSQYSVTSQIIRCDSGATAYKSSRYQYEGTETTETSITRVGGASDPTGQAQSRKIATTANSQWLRPFKAEPYAVWNSTVGSVTVTVCGTINAGALPNNDDIWLEVEYLNDPASPLGAIVTTTKANLLAVNAAVASDSSTWNNAAYATLSGPATGGVTVSNGGLTATHNSGNGVGVSGPPIGSGKYYFECTLTLHSGNGGGVGLSFLPVDYVNVPSAVWAQFSTAGTIFLNNVVSSGYTIGPFGTGDVLGVAIDLTNNLVWFRRNNGNWNGNSTANPVTGVNGAALPAGTYVPFVDYTSVNGATDATTFNFGASAYSGAVPSGFSNWIGYTPFKLATIITPDLAGYIHARIRAAKPSTTYYIDPQVTLS